MPWHFDWVSVSGRRVSGLLSFSLTDTILAYPEKCSKVGEAIVGRCNGDRGFRGCDVTSASAKIPLIFGEVECNFKIWNCGLIRWDSVKGVRTMRVRKSDLRALTSGEEKAERKASALAHEGGAGVARVFTPQVKALIVARLERAPTPAIACRELGVSMAGLAAAWRTDVAFYERCRMAMQCAAEAVEASVYERALESDSLATFVLKAAKPEVYGDRLKVEADVTHEIVVDLVPS